MCELSCLNSGDARYKLNSDSHSSALAGGRLPVTGFHTVILRLFDFSKVATKTQIMHTQILLAESSLQIRLCRIHSLHFLITNTPPPSHSSSEKSLTSCMVFPDLPTSMCLQQPGKYIVD